MSRRRRGTYLTLLAVAGAALSADRWVFLGSEATAPERARGENALEPAAPALPVADAQSGTSIPEMPFPKHIPPAELQGPIRDLFAPPVRVSSKHPGEPGGDKQASDNPESGEEEPADSDTFVSRHRLNGVLIDESLKIAILDGMWVRIGQAVSGCTLVTVTGNAASFACSDGEAVLNVGDGPKARGD